MATAEVIWNTKDGPTVECFPDLHENQIICISLAAGIKDSLDWQEEINSADIYVSSDAHIMWDLQLGLFSELQSLNENSMELKSLHLALEQFSSSIWDCFEQQSVGILLYRGRLDISKEVCKLAGTEADFLEWLSEIEITPENADARELYFSLFSAHLATEYLQKLAAHLPMAATAYLIIEIDPKLSLAIQAFMLNQERFGHLKPLVIGSSHNIHHAATLGICLPPLSKSYSTLYSELEPLFQELQALNIAYRLIPEESLTALWHGLDEIIIPTATTTAMTKRKLQGFAAAGGKTIAYSNSLLGIANEELYAEWKVLRARS